MGQEPSKGSKATKAQQKKSATKGTGFDVVADWRPKVPAWSRLLVLYGAPFPFDSSIRDFQQGKVGYVVDLVEQALLLPRDMVELRNLKKCEVFLSLNFRIWFPRDFLSLV